jgi:hypothetical protein
MVAPVMARRPVQCTVSDVIKTLEGIVPKAKKVLDNAADIAGKKNKPAQRVADDCRKLLEFRSQKKTVGGNEVQDRLQRPRQAT